jgi:RNA polymerase sigma-70 factor (ECF subfamily)
VRIIKTHSLDQIIAECRKGKPRAQKRLYDRFSGKMYAICLRYSKNEFDAQDIFQEGFVKVFDKIDQLEDSERIEAWMKRIFIHTALRFLENRKRLLFQELEESHESVIAYQFSPCEYDELLCLIAQLPEGYQAVFNLNVVDGYSHKEIADILNITESTSRSQLNRAKKLLQRKLEEQVASKINHQSHG